MVWRDQGIYIALRKLFRETGAISQNLSRPDGERRVTNFLHLAEVLHQVTSEKPMSPSSLVIWLRAKMEEKDRSKEEFQVRLESESDKIRILTIHKSKGLEYPITFIPDLGFSSTPRKGTFTYHSANGDLVVDLRELASEESLALGRLEERREDARLLYVALTRASSCCYLYHPPFASTEEEQSSAQGFILNQIKQSVSEGSMQIWIDQSDLDNSISHEMLSLPVSALKTSSLELTVRSQTERGPLVSAQFPSGRSIPRVIESIPLVALRSKLISTGQILIVPIQLRNYMRRWKRRPIPFLNFLLVLMQEILCMIFSSIWSSITPIHGLL